MCNTSRMYGSQMWRYVRRARLAVLRLHTKQTCQSTAGLILDIGQCDALRDRVSSVRRLAGLLSFTKSLHRDGDTPMRLCSHLMLSDSKYKSFSFFLMSLEDSGQYILIAVIQFTICCGQWFAIKTWREFPPATEPLLYHLQHWKDCSRYLYSRGGSRKPECKFY